MTKEKNIIGFKKQETTQEAIPSAKEMIQIKPFQQTMMPSMSNNMQLSMMPSSPSMEYPILTQRNNQEEMVGTPSQNNLINPGVIEEGILPQRPVHQLTGEEIDELISHFAQRARIPPIGGVFKAAIGNLIISAIISDFAGTRFHIDKKTQPMMPMPRY